MSVPKKIILLLAFLIVGAVLCGGGLYCYFKSLTHYPVFYSSLLKVEDKQLEEGAQEALIHFANLANQVKREARWELNLSQNQINGWLEKGINSQFPGLMPDGTYYPRVQLETDRIYYAQEYCPDNFESVVWAQICVDIPEPGVVCVTLEKMRMGLLPISQRLVKSDLEQKIKKWNLPFELSINSRGQLEVSAHLGELDPDNDWRVDPTVYKGRKLTLDNVEITPERIRLSGTVRKINEK